MSDQPQSHLDHLAPVRHLVRQLHQGRTVAQNTIRLRWKRKKAKPVEPMRETQP